jgi:hypothetical protein
MEEPNKVEKKASFFIGQDKFVNTTGLKFPNNYLSISQINKYTMCPRSYYFSYIEERKEPAGAALIGGQVTHKVLELIGQMKGIDFTDEMVSHHFERLFKDQFEATDPRYRVEQSYDDMYAEVAPLIPSLRWYVKNELPKLKIIGQEVQVSKEVPVYRSVMTSRGKVAKEMIGNITFAGFVDMFNNTGNVSVPPMDSVYKDVPLDVATQLEIGDYKTGSVQDMSFFAYDLQLAFYAYATNVMNVRVDNIPAVKTKVLKTGKPSKTDVAAGANILRFKETSDSVAHTLAQLSDAAIGIGSGAFPQCNHKFWLCSPKYCHHWSYCRGSHPASVYLKKSDTED